MSAVVTLTAREAECLAHRLGSDGLVEVTMEEGFAPQDVLDAVDAVAVMVACRRIDELALDPVSKSVLRDCVEGSTWAACLDDFDRADVAAAKRTLRGLCAKLETVGLSDVEMPAP